jgi:hypothetical protein
LNSDVPSNDGESDVVKINEGEENEKNLR